jgi:phosphoribosyl-AMP cyclohydrolase
MEHPLITDANDLNIEDLSSRITDLQRKLAWARRYNAALANQVAMALETYTNKYQQRQREAWEKTQNSGTDYSDRIDIS